MISVCSEKRSFQLHFLSFAFSNGLPALAFSINRTFLLNFSCHDNSIDTSLSILTSRQQSVALDMAYNNRHSSNTMRPTGLTIQCARCTNFMPFDPQAQNQLCNGCNRMLALGGGFYEPNNTTHQPQNHVQTDRHSTNSHQNHQNMSTPGHQASMYATPSQPSMTPQIFQTTPCPLPSQAGTGPQGLKRRHEISFDQQYPNKRPHEKSYAPHTPSGLRRNVSPSAIGAREAASMDGESENEGGDEEFEDARESQEQDAQSVVDDRDGSSEADAEGEDEEVREVEDEPRDVEAEEGEQEHEADDDLFTSAFGKDAGKRSDDSDAESDDSTTPKKKKKKEKHSNTTTNNNTNNDDDNDTPTATDQPFNRSALLANLTSSQPTRTTATPAPKKKHPKPKPQTSDAIPPPATIPRDLAHNLRKQHSFHTSALEFLPRLPLAEHRFWYAFHTPFPPSITSPP